MNGVDLARFDFDYDVTWNGFFLDEKLNVYSRYGGRDGGNPENRLSRESLLQTMTEVLAAHESRAMLQASGEPVFHPVPDEPRLPEDMPLLRKNHQGCLHCHQVREYSLLQSFHAGTFQRKELFPYPLPENLGIVIDRGHGHRIQQIRADSAAAQAKLQAGDVIVKAGGIPVRSEYDLRWILHRLPDERNLEVHVERAEPISAETNDTGSSPRASVPVKVELILQNGWRHTDLGWRKSLRSVPVPFGLRGYELTRSQRREIGQPEEGTLAIRIVSVPPGGLGERLGVMRKDTIVALDDRTEPRSFEQLKSDMLARYRPGDTVQLTVLREGETLQLSGPFPDWFTSDTRVPN